MRITFLGGGTGGHLVPGVAVAEELRQRGHETLFLIAGRPVEHAVLEPRQLPSRQLFGDRPRPSPVDLPRWVGATARWRRAVLDFDPQAIVVLGGWVALPAVFTGFFGRRSVLIEQNARPGRVQRMLGQRIEHACLTVDGAGMPRGRRSTCVTGNPAPALPRRSRLAAAAALGLDPERRTLLLMGGSQGAADVNALLPGLLTVLSGEADPWQVLNITGSRPCPALGAPPDVPVHRRRFVQDMAAVYSVTDLAVCRAGGGTIAELTCTGTPSVLVPYPYHADRHQEANGQRLVDVGGALMVGREDPSGQRSAAALVAQALPRLPAMSEAARSLARPEAARDVAEIVLAAASEGA